MNVFSVFNVPTIVSRQPSDVPSRRFGPAPIDEGGGQAGANAQGRERTVGAFITVQSLVSFSGATGVIGLLWSAIESLFKVHAPWNLYIGLSLSLLVGMFIYYINISDPNTTTQTRRDKIIGFVIAFLNSLVLFSATKSILSL